MHCGIIANRPARGQRARLRKTSVRGSANSPGWRKVTSLSSSMAYQSFFGGVAGFITATIRASLIPRRHQLFRIAHDRQAAGGIGWRGFQSSFHSFSETSTRLDRKHPTWWNHRPLCPFGSSRERQESSPPTDKQCSTSAASQMPLPLRNQILSFRPFWP